MATKSAGAMTVSEPPASEEETARATRRELSRSPFAFALLVSLALVAFYNWRFWTETVAAAHPTAIKDFLFLASIAVILFLAHAALLLLMPGTRSLRIAAAGLFLIAAVAAFFVDSYDVIIDKEMIRNVFETDRQEAGAFLVPSFGAYLLLLGVIPAIIALRAPLVAPSLSRRLTQRLGFFAASLVVSAGLIHLFFPYYTAFFTEQRTGAWLNPLRPISGFVGYLRGDLFRADDRFVDDPENHAHRLAGLAAEKPLLLFLVVGEAARAKNFQLGGYARQTNPELSHMSSLYYFDNVVSCGTSTAVSVPCIFAPHGHEGFDATGARHQGNLLDALKSAGVAVEWRENNSSSKSVASRVRTLNFLGGATAVQCGKDGCYDEDMISGLAEKLKSIERSGIIVFHDMGSHGPAYWRRYPPRFEQFRPVCRTSELWTCSHEALVNTYDNTILHTDHVLAEQIRLLDSLSAFADTLLIYVSDHGESLGEHGLYLHGAPYAFAPEEQTRVPLLIWMSEGYRQHYIVEEKCLRAERHRSLTHDVIYHTVLGALGLRNADYRPDLDLVGACWRIHQDRPRHG